LGSFIDQAFARLNNNRQHNRGRPSRDGSVQALPTFASSSSANAFLRRLRIARITPKELRDKLTAGENIAIVDLRQPVDIEAFPQMIPGALRVAMEEIEERHGEIPGDRDVVRSDQRPVWCCCCEPQESPNKSITHA
jgi:rhodanese-related sulfurtransferase